MKKFCCGSLSILFLTLGIKCPMTLPTIMESLPVIYGFKSYI